MEVKPHRSPTPRKLRLWKLNTKETQSRGGSKKPSMLEARTPKTKTKTSKTKTSKTSAECSRSSDSDYRRPVVKEEALPPVVGRTWPAKSKFLYNLSSLVSSNPL